MKCGKTVRYIAIFIVWMICLMYIVGGGAQKNAITESSALIQAQGVQYVLANQVQIRATARQNSLHSLEIFLGESQPKVQQVEFSIQNAEGEVIFHSTQSIGEQNCNSVASFPANVPLESGENYEFYVKAQNDAQIAVGRSHAAYERDGEILLDGQQTQDLLIQARYILPVSKWEAGAYGVLAIVYAALATAVVWFAKDIFEYAGRVGRSYFSKIEQSRKICSWWALSLPMEVVAIYFTFRWTLENVMDGFFVFVVIMAGLLCTAVLPITYKKIENQYRKAGIAAGWGIALYAAFALCGNYLFVYPVGRMLEISSVVQYSICCIWMSPLIFGALYVLSHGTLCHRPAGQKMPVWLTLALIVIVVLPVCYVLLGVNPCVSSPDSDVCLAQGAHQIYGLVNWHPPFYVLCLAALVEIWDSTYMIILTQAAIFLWAWCRLCGLLYKKGISVIGIVLATAFVAVIPSTPLLICTIWKDVPYTFLLLLLTVLIMEYTELPERRKNWMFVLEVAVVLTGVALIRANGIVPFALMIIALAAARQLGKLRFVSIGLSIVFIGIIVGPVYRHIDVQPVPENNTGGAYVGLVQDLLGVYHSGGTISQKTMELLEETSNGKLQSGTYTPYTFWMYQMAYSGSASDVIVAYLNTFVKNPVRIVQQVACRTDGVWNIAAAKGAPAVLTLSGYTGQSVGDTWMEYYPQQKENSFTQSVQEYVAGDIAYTFKGVLAWRSGIWTLLAVICAVSWILQRRPWWMMIVYVPLVGQILSLVLSTGWNDHRYFWPLQLMSIAIFLLSMVTNSRLQNEKEDEYRYDF